MFAKIMIFPLSDGALSVLFLTTIVLFITRVIVFIVVALRGTQPGFCLFLFFNTARSEETRR